MLILANALEKALERSIELLVTTLASVFVVESRSTGLTEGAQSSRKCKKRESASLKENNVLPRRCLPCRRTPTLTTPNVNVEEPREGSFDARATKVAVMEVDVAGVRQEPKGRTRAVCSKSQGSQT
jgi:hypothetical protein